MNKIITDDKTYYASLDSSIGQLLVVANNKGLTYLGLVDAKHSYQIQPEWVEDKEIMQPYISQLLDYFDGSLDTFTLPLNLQGTDFQRQVWQALTEIPYGETWSYKQVAEHIGRPKAARAVGAANGRNPISIVIPCHRVIGSNGSLTGYAGGMDAKRALLQIESKEPLLFDPG